MAEDFVHSDDCPETCYFLRDVLERKGDLKFVHLAGSMGQASKRVRCRAGKNDLGIKSFIHNHPKAFIHKKDVAIRLDNDHGNISKRKGKALKFLSKYLADKGLVNTGDLVNDLEQAGKGARSVLSDKESILSLASLYPDVFLVCGEAIGSMPQAETILEQLCDKEAASGGAVQVSKEDAAKLLASVEEISHPTRKKEQYANENACGFLRNLLKVHERMHVANVAIQGGTRLPAPVKDLLNDPTKVVTFVKKYPDIFIYENENVMLTEQCNESQTSKLSDGEQDILSSTQSLPAMFARESQYQEITPHTDPGVIQMALGFIRNRIKEHKEMDVMGLVKGIKKSLPMPAKNIVNTQSKLVDFVQAYLDVFCFDGKTISLKQQTGKALLSRDGHGSSQSLPATFNESESLKYDVWQNPPEYQQACDFIREQLVEHTRIHVVNIAIEAGTGLPMPTRNLLDSPEKVTRFVQLFPAVFKIDDQIVTLSGCNLHETSSYSGEGSVHESNNSMYTCAGSVQSDMCSVSDALLNQSSDIENLEGQSGSIVLLSKNYGVIQSDSKRVYFKSNVCDFFEEGVLLTDHLSKGQSVKFDAVPGPTGVAYSLSATRVSLEKGLHDSFIDDQGITDYDESFSVSSAGSRQEHDHLPTLQDQPHAFEDLSALNNERGTVTCVTKDYGMLKTDKGSVYFRKIVCDFCDEERDLTHFLKDGQTLVCDAVLGPDNVSCKWLATRVTMQELSSDAAAEEEKILETYISEPEDQQGHKVENDIIEGRGVVIYSFNTFALLMAFDSSGQELVVYCDRGACDFLTESSQLDKILSDGDGVFFTAKHVPDGQLYKWVATKARLPDSGQIECNEATGNVAKHKTIPSGETHKNDVKKSAGQESDQSNVNWATYILPQTIPSDNYTLPGQGDQIEVGPNKSILEDIWLDVPGDFRTKDYKQNEKVGTSEEGHKKLSLTKNGQEALNRLLKERVENTKSLFEEKFVSADMPVPWQEPNTSATTGPSSSSSEDGSDPPFTPSNPVLPDTEPNHDISTKPFTKCDESEPVYPYHVTEDDDEVHDPLEQERHEDKTRAKCNLNSQTDHAATPNDRSIINKVASDPVDSAVPHPASERLERASQHEIAEDCDHINLSLQEEQYENKKSEEDNITGSQSASFEDCISSKGQNILPFEEGESCQRASTIQHEETSGQSSPTADESDSGEDGQQPFSDNCQVQCGLPETEDNSDSQPETADDKQEKVDHTIMENEPSTLDQDMQFEDNIGSQDTTRDPFESRVLENQSHADRICPLEANIEESVRENMSTVVEVPEKCLKTDTITCPVSDFSEVQDVKTGGDNVSIERKTETGSVISEDLFGESTSNDDLPLITSRYAEGSSSGVQDLARCSSLNMRTSFDFSTESQVAVVFSPQDNIFLQTLRFFLFVLHRRHPNVHSWTSSLFSVMYNIFWMLENVSPYQDIIPNRYPESRDATSAESNEEPCFQGSDTVIYVAEVQVENISQLSGEHNKSNTEGMAGMTSPPVQMPSTTGTSSSFERDRRVFETLDSRAEGVKQSAFMQDVPGSLVSQITHGPSKETFKTEEHAASATMNPVDTHVDNAGKEKVNVGCQTCSTGSIISTTAFTD